MRNLIELLNRSADEFGDGVAAIYRGDPVSFVQLPTVREIRRWCAQRLASFKVPQQVDFADELPRNPSGKVVKRRLR